MNVKLQDSIDTHTWNIEPVFQLRSFLWMLFWIFELLLVMRFFLKLFTAQAASLLEKATFYFTDYLLTPFTTVLQTSTTTGPTFEWVTLLAMFGYWLLVSGLMVWLGSENTVSEVEIARANSKRRYGH